MDRRAFMLFAAAGVASPDQTLKALIQGAESGSAPAPIAGSGDAGFDAWLADFIQRQVALGWPQELLRQHLEGLTPDPRVVALDRRQPEFSKPVGDYLRGAVSDDRISIGRSKRAAATWLGEVERRYGPPPEILVAIWGMESAFGAAQGEMDVVRSLATLAAEGRRRAWAEGELLAALRMLRDGDATRGALKGSWAGAMGQTQFMPSTFLTTAVDEDGDGRRDIWGSSADALGSAANLLAKAGWKRGQTWAREVILPAGFDYSQAEGPRLPPSAWEFMGARRADGLPWAAADAQAEAGLIVPAGHLGPAFLVFENHFTIRKYNNSTAYALAVGMLADRMLGADALVAAWPYEQPMSSADRIGAQKALVTLGFDPGEPDGVIGVNTRAAVRAYQKTRGLVADGYLTADLAQTLMRQATQAPSSQ